MFKRIFNKESVPQPFSPSPLVSSRVYSVHTENNEQLIIIIIINLYVHPWVRIESKSFARILDIIITRLSITLTSIFLLI